MVSSKAGNGSGRLSPASASKLHQSHHHRHGRGPHVVAGGVLRKNAVRYAGGEGEWFVMTPILLQQFRISYAQDRPVGVVLWAKVDDEVEQRLKNGATKLRPQDWKSGTKPHVVEVIAPFGGAEEMVQEWERLGTR